MATKGVGNGWRRGLALGLVPLVGVLAAGTTSAASPPGAYLNQAGLRTAVRPSFVRFREYHSADLHTLVNAAVSGVSWSSWGGATAAGSGQALIQWTDAATGLHAQAHATVPVMVSATGLRSCGGVSVYTSLVINVAAGATAPPHFAQVQDDREVLPCAVHAANYIAGQSERGDPNGCLFKGLRELVIRSPFSLSYCAMRWRGWGHSTTTGLGVARIGFSQYGLRVKLSRLRWCAKWTVSYTQETAEIWGAGEALTGQGNVSSSQAARLRGLVGRPGQPHKTVRLTTPAGAGCIP
ncbi:MAG: hypothetical protein ACRDLF_00735 [Solirubrobacteraceae bacterium]